MEKAALCLPGCSCQGSQSSFSEPLLPSLTSGVAGVVEESWVTSLNVGSWSRLSVSSLCRCQDNWEDYLWEKQKLQFIDYLLGARHNLNCCVCIVSVPFYDVAAFSGCCICHDFKDKKTKENKRLVFIRNNKLEIAPENCGCHPPA